MSIVANGVRDAKMGPRSPYWIAPVPNPELLATDSRDHRADSLRLSLRISAYAEWL